MMEVDLYPPRSAVRSMMRRRLVLPLRDHSWEQWSLLRRCRASDHCFVVVRSLERLSWLVMLLQLVISGGEAHRC